MSFPIVNPGVYLNYLTPSVASDYEWDRNITLATLGGLVWDILSSIPEDYRLIRTRKFSVALSAYFAARPAALAMIIVTVLQQTGPITDCRLLAIISGAFQVISYAAASYLFLKRVHTVYYMNRLVKYAFSFLWLLSIGASCAVFPGAVQDYSEIADTKHCIRAKSSSTLPVAYICAAYFDVVVYTAITWKIFATHRQEPRQRWWKALFYRRKQALPRFSRALLQSGQQYYL
ncbi:hypothetical protein ID866_8427 [Astraeus odoratus]|nr:hypothetical protein ID866_8427 [Astraeus odoratus]